MLALIRAVVLAFGSLVTSAFSITCAMSAYWLPCFVWAVATVLLFMSSYLWFGTYKMRKKRLREELVTKSCESEQDKIRRVGIERWLGK